MLRFLLGRLAVLIPTFIGVSIIAFSFIRLLPGDPVMLMSGERVMSQERYEKISQELGYDRQNARLVGGLLEEIETREQQRNAVLADIDRLRRERDNTFEEFDRLDTDNKKRAVDLANLIERHTAKNPTATVQLKNN